MKHKKRILPTPSECKIDEKAKQPGWGKRESSSGLVGKSNQPQHSLNPMPNPEQSPNSSFLGTIREVGSLQKKCLKLAEAAPGGLRKEGIFMPEKCEAKQQERMKKL